MSPHLRVLAGTNPDALVPINSIVNTSKAYSIRSDLFQGEIVANIKGMTDENGRVRDSEYFRREEKQDVSWSIQVQGRFFLSSELKEFKLTSCWIFFKDVSWFLRLRMIFYLETPLIGH